MTARSDTRASKVGACEMVLVAKFRAAASAAPLSCAAAIAVGGCPVGGGRVGLGMALTCVGDARVAGLGFVGEAGGGPVEGGRCGHSTEAVRLGPPAAAAHHPCHLRGGVGEPLGPDVALVAHVRRRRGVGGLVLHLRPRRNPGARVA